MPAAFHEEVFLHGRVSLRTKVGKQWRDTESK